MTAHTDPIKRVLGSDGSMARTLKEFEYRSSQISMAGLIQKAVDKETPAIIEAGTGTGKTLGYLVPLLLSGKKAVVSTGTKNLQEQIFFKDIPLLTKATGIKADAILMKGRKNYLCLSRHNQFFANMSLLNPERERARKKIETWLKKTIFADLAELSWMKDDDPLQDAISATSEQCLGSDCIHLEDCYLNKLRRGAAQARLIIVNHHLFFADLMVKKGGFGEIFPRFQVVVFDEAHNVEEIATSYFGESLSTYQLTELVDDMEKEISRIGRAAENKLKKYLRRIRRATEHLRIFFGESNGRGRLDQDTIQKFNQGPAREIRKGLGYILGKSGFGDSGDISAQDLVSRADELNQRLQNILTLNDPNWLLWYEKRKKSVVLHASPLDISSNMQDLLYQKKITAVFTSATLSTNGDFDYIRSRLGLSNDVLEGIYPSHFDYEKQTIMYIPRDLSPPGDVGFGLSVAERIVKILEITSGRALILFTSYYNLNLVYNFINGKMPYTIYKQGDGPRSILLEQFKRDTHSILLATASFWQGVDVPGEALSCLIIDKLPFDSPGEPLVQARIEAIRDLGKNPFMEYQLPSAIISLKQGLGRLIRNSSDIGVLSILDNRILKNRYGDFFLESLPKIPIRHELSDIRHFFKEREKNDT